MDRERAETHLRQVAEAGLRSGDGGRVLRVAQALLAVGALDDEVAAQILGDFDLATGTLIRPAGAACSPGRRRGRLVRCERPGLPRQAAASSRSGS
jgi:hypothetical protein